MTDAPSRERSPAEHRSHYPHFEHVTTRWHDNDVYGHVNNVVYYAYFDTAVNARLVAHGVLAPEASPVIGLVAETRCRYLSPISFPDRVAVGVRVARIGRSSVTYELAIFRNDEETAAAVGHFVHVYVDRENRRPAVVPDDVRATLAPLAGPGGVG